MANRLFVGLMSGTSLDGVDAVVVEFDEAARKVQQVACRHDQFPAALKQTLFEVIQDPDKLDQDLHRELDLQLARLYSDSTLKLLATADIPATSIYAIGCHGQTVNHQPDANPPFSIQLGDGQALANQTGITTVCDFRRADIEAGGQGAPLAPGFHEWAFAQPDEVTSVINLGGIANITVLNPTADLLGYDTGPANTLLDLWCEQHLHEPYDTGGAWAATGKIDEELIKQMLADDYFKRPFPKSTGREYFNQQWLNRQLQNRGGDLAPADVQASLSELTARSVAAEVLRHGCRAAWLCGGGAHNANLRDRLQTNLGDVRVASTAALGVEPDWVEAVAFAWLALARVNNVAAGRPSVTGARCAALLGDIKQPLNS